MQLEDFDFALPSELIAQRPASPRSASRLLHVDVAAGRLIDRGFADLPTLVDARDLLLANNTRVMAARLHGHKDSGGRVEVFVERIVGDHEALAFLRASRLPRPGSAIRLPNETIVEVICRDGELFRVRFIGRKVADVLAAIGAVPLPPYIRHVPDDEDSERYQTVFATVPGAVAAPTAGLHFDEATIARIRASGARISPLTLHVGAGTFQPVKSANIDEHRMHRERYAIPGETLRAIREARAVGGRVLAVGTTSLRAVESAAIANADFDASAVAIESDTALFVRPGFRFQVIERLLTNFHLPKSTLLMLVSAFAGVELVREAYAHAIRQRYRFFSYGDAMLIDRPPPRKAP